MLLWAVRSDLKVLPRFKISFEVLRQALNGFGLKLCMLTVVIVRWCCSHSYGLDAFVVYSSSYRPTVVIPSRFLVVVVGEDVRYFWASKQGEELCISEIWVS